MPRSRQRLLSVGTDGWRSVVSCYVKEVHTTGVAEGILVAVVLGR